MHDRAIIFFTDGETVSSGICLFRSGSKVPALLTETAERIACTKEPAATARAVSILGAPTYYANRFLGVYAEFYTLSGNVHFVPDHVDEDLNAVLCRAVWLRSGPVPGLASGVLQTLSCDLGLEAGLVVVDVSTTTWSWRAFGGYLQGTSETPDSGWLEVDFD